MNYSETTGEVFEIVREAWNKVDSGFYPEIDEEIKLFTIQRKISVGRLEEGFWDLVRFLIKDLLAMSEEDLPEERTRLVSALKELAGQANVQQWLAKLKTESQMGKKAMGIIESLQKSLRT